MGGRRLRACASPCASAPPQRSPSRSARVAPGGPTLPHPTAPVQPPSSRAGPLQPLARRAPAGLRCGPGRAGSAVGGACSLAGGAGGVLPGWWRKNAVCFSYPPLAERRLVRKGNQAAPRRPLQRANCSSGVKQKGWPSSLVVPPYRQPASARREKPARPLLCLVSLSAVTLMVHSNQSC